MRTFYVVKSCLHDNLSNERHKTKNKGYSYWFHSDMTFAVERNIRLQEDKCIAIGRYQRWHVFIQKKRPGSLPDLKNI